MKFQIDPIAFFTVPVMLFGFVLIWRAVGFPAALGVFLIAFAAGCKSNLGDYEK